MKNLFGCLFAALLSACATTNAPLILYPGPPKPDDQIAILTSHYTDDAKRLVASEFGTAKGLRSATIHS